MYGSLSDWLILGARAWYVVAFFAAPTLALTGFWTAAGVTYGATGLVYAVLDRATNEEPSRPFIAALLNVVLWPLMHFAARTPEAAKRRLDPKRWSVWSGSLEQRWGYHATAEEAVNAARRELPSAGPFSSPYVFDNATYRPNDEGRPSPVMWRVTELSIERMPESWWRFAAFYLVPRLSGSDGYRIGSALGAIAGCLYGLAQSVIWFGGAIYGFVAVSWWVGLLWLLTGWLFLELMDQVLGTMFNTIFRTQSRDDPPPTY